MGETKAQKEARLERQGEQDARQFLRSAIAEATKAAEDTLPYNSPLGSKQDPEEGTFADSDFKSNNLLKPPFDPNKMYKIVEDSQILPQCIDAMVQNIHGYGFDFSYDGENEEDKITDEEKKERKDAKLFLKKVNENQSFVSLCCEVREDIETIGYSFVEIIRNRKGEVALLYRVDPRIMRLQAIQEEAQPATTLLIRNGKPIEIPVSKHFRRYALLRGKERRKSKIRWFKEFGDPRKMDRYTGAYEKEEDFGKNGGNESEYLASEILHFKLGNDTYGIPRWSGQVLVTLGMQASEFVNYDLFSNQVVPPLAFMVSGGTLTKESVRDITNVLIQKRGIHNFNKVLIIETRDQGNVSDKDSAKVEVKELSQARKEDAMFTEYTEKGKSKVRSAFKLPPMLLGLAESYSKSCYSADTQTLTENGWKYYYDIFDGEKIATYNPETNQIEYHEPEGGLYSYEHSGEMIHFCNRNMDILVTEDHIIWSCSMPSYQKKELEFKKYKAENFTNVRCKMLSAPLSKVQNLAIDEGVFRVPYIPHGTRSRNYSAENYRAPLSMEIFMELIGWVVTDGCPTTENRPDMNYIGFGFTKQRKIDRFRELSEVLKTHGFIVYVGQIGENNRVDFHINDRGLYQWVIENCGRYSANKKLPFKISELKTSYLDILLDTVLFCDGTEDSRDGRNSYGFYSESTILVDQVQEISILLGHRCNKINTNRLSITFNKPIFEVNKGQVERVSYSGIVYCYNVPNHLFVTRRNGKVAIQGNTADSSKQVAEEQVFVPERNRFDDVINTLLMPEFGVQNWKYKSQGPKLIMGDDIKDIFNAFSKQGAFTINQSIRLVNKLLGTDITEYDEDWAKIPAHIVMEYARQGLLDIDGVSSATDSIADMISNPENSDDPQKLAAIYKGFMGLSRGLEKIKMDQEDKLKEILEEYEIEEE